MHEASSYEDNCFLTLTYDDAHVPRDGSLRKREFPDFMRRLRKTGVRARYFHCGEYGDSTSRPHYHACLFGHSFPDRAEWTTRGENIVWRSAELERLWPLGLSEIGSLTFESAAYVARYVCKKVTGRRAEGAYSRVDDATGEMFQIEPEFATMSRRPGIGARWFAEFSSEVFPADEVIVRGHAVKPPRFYDERLSEGELEELKAARQARGFRKFYDRGAARLQVREVCTKSRMSLCSRSLD